MVETFDEWIDELSETYVDRCAYSKKPLWIEDTVWVDKDTGNLFWSETEWKAYFKEQGYGDEDIQQAEEEVMEFLSMTDIAWEKWEAGECTW